jgi:uncharacterized phage-associated protein
MQLIEKIEQSLHTMLYVLNSLGNFVDFHKLFKIMYFADQKHLVKYGNPITNDQYIAMSNGPVPSIAYDILKAVKKESITAKFHDSFINYFEINEYYVKAKQKANPDYLSESEIKCLNESIQDNKDLSFNDLTDKSHDIAWEMASNQKNPNIELTKIAEAGGANPEMLSYIETCLENNFAVFE